MRRSTLMPALWATCAVLAFSQPSSAQDVTPDRSREELVYPSPGPSWTERGKLYFQDLGGNQTLCSAPTGQQSPVDVPYRPGLGGTSPATIKYTFLFQPARDLKVIKNDHAVEVEMPEEGPVPMVEMAGPSNTTMTYKLAAFHFHHPSEHLMNGVRFPMEMHLVHEDVTNKERKLVIGRLLTIRPRENLGTSDQHILRHVFRLLAAASERKPVGSEKVEIGTIQLPGGGSGVPPSPAYADLLASFGDLSRFTAMHYTGSLTTPACSQNVIWFVEPTGGVSVTQDEVDTYKRHYPMTARPTQQLLSGTAFDWGQLNAVVSSRPEDTPRESPGDITESPN